MKCVNKLTELEYSTNNWIKYVNQKIQLTTTNYVSRLPKRQSSHWPTSEESEGFDVAAWITTGSDELSVEG